MGTIPTGYYPPVGSVFCLHGGQSQKPVRMLGNTSQVALCDTSLITVTSDYADPEYGDRSHVKRTVGNADLFHPPHVLKNLGEGETSCIYYSLANLGKDHLIITSDGDMISLALLATRFRMDPTMQKFVNKVFVLLRVPYSKVAKSKAMAAAKLATEGEKKISQSSNLYVDVNELYHSILFKGPFSGFVDPIASYVAILSLMGNDYIKNFAPGMTGGMDTVRQMSWFWLPILNRPGRYRSMVKMVQKGGDLPSSINPNVEARIAARSSVFSPDEEEEEDITIEYPHSEEEQDHHHHRHPYFKEAVRVKQQMLEESILRTTQSYEAVIDIEDFIEFTHECYHYKYKDVAAVKTRVKKTLQIVKKRRTKKNDGEPLGNPNATYPFPDAMDIPDKHRRRVSPASSHNNDNVNVIPSEDNYTDHILHFDTYTECIREHLSTTKNNAMMTDQEIRAFARNIKWLLEYWSNSYIGDCTYPNPCETFNGKSYYGWARSTEDSQGCYRTSDISEEKPTSNKWPSWLSPSRRFGSNTNESEDRIGGESNHSNARVGVRSSTLPRYVEAESVDQVRDPMISPFGARTLNHESPSPRFPPDLLIHHQMEPPSNNTFTTTVTAATTDLNYQQPPQQKKRNHSVVSTPRKRTTTTPTIKVTNSIEEVVK